MNDFQNIGIFLQLTAIIILLSKIVGTLDCIGISGRTQLLYALVFTTRFLDLPYELSISLPSFILKIVYLIVAYLTIIFIFIVCRATYEHEFDTFRIDLLIGVCTVMALLSTFKKWHVLSIFWYFSTYLEAFAIFPQIQFTAKTRYVGSSLVFYVGMLACYRGFYIVHWAYLFLAEGQPGNIYVTVAGIVQFLIFTVYFFWMMPIFRARYTHLKSEATKLDTMAIVTMQVNGTENSSRQRDSTLNN